MAKYSSSLLMNINDLLLLQGVEKQRVEFKKAWHSKGLKEALIGKSFTQFAPSQTTSTMTVADTS